MLITRKELGFHLSWMVAMTKDLSGQTHIRLTSVLHVALSACQIEQPDQYNRW